MSSAPPQENATCLGHKQVAVTLMIRFNYCKLLPDASSVFVIAFPLLSEILSTAKGPPSLKLSVWGPFTLLGLESLRPP